MNLSVCVSVYCISQWGCISSCLVKPDWLQLLLSTHCKLSCRMFHVWVLLTSSHLTCAFVSCCLITCSHRRHGRDKTVLSCLCLWCEHNWRQDKTVLSCLDPVSNLQLFSLKYIEDYWKSGNWVDKTKLSGLVCRCVHTINNR